MMGNCKWINAFPPSASRCTISNYFVQSHANTPACGSGPCSVDPSRHNRLGGYSCRQSEEDTCVGETLSAELAEPVRCIRETYRHGSSKQSVRGGLLPGWQASSGPRTREVCRRRD